MLALTKVTELSLVLGIAIFIVGILTGLLLAQFITDDEERKDD